MRAWRIDLSRGLPLLIGFVASPVGDLTVRGRLSILMMHGPPP
jgi:hypothetical protein